METHSNNLHSTEMTKFINHENKEITKTDF